MPASDPSALIGPGRVVTPRGSVMGTVRIEGGRIAEIAPADGDDAGAGTIIAPGFVDLQVNGVDDIDVTDADGDDWDRLGARLAATGVTAWLPTLITRPVEDYDAPLARIEAARHRPPAGAIPLGAHLEGPFLGSVHGAHPSALVVPIDLAWLSALPSTVRLLTLGPEQPDAVAAVRALRARDVVVSLGHSAADVETTTAAVDAGAAMVTHLFNALGPLHHRAPGIVGVALADRRLTAGVIPDLVHVHPTMLRTAFAAKGADRVAVVTDSVAWRSPAFAALGIAVVDGAPRLADGTIAGSCLTMDAAIRNLVDHAGVPPDDAIRAASTTPAQVLGERTRGRLEAGARGDVVVLGADDLAVRRTVLAGRTVWEA